jgi:hypothetical protein
MSLLPIADRFLAEQAVLGTIGNRQWAIGNIVNAAT